MNLIKITFSIFTFYIGFSGGLLVLFKNDLPVFLRQSYRYGKFAEKISDPFISKLEIPKRWFKHFYYLAAPLSTYALFLSMTKYFYNENIPEYIYSYLDFLLGSDRQPLVPLANTLLATTLLTIHCLKRFYETQIVNVFSDAKMNISHYVVGMIHYISVVAVILGESEGFVKGFEVNFQNSLKIKDWISALIFLWMSYQQLKSNCILSSLRKDEKGVVVTKEYKIPTGGLFDYISGPLQFTEIGVYGALKIILCESSTYTSIYLWVVTNQFMCALLSHQWHKEIFKNYPPSRKIIIPYLL